MSTADKITSIVLSNKMTKRLRKQTFNLKAITTKQSLNELTISDQNSVVEYITRISQARANKITDLQTVIYILTEKNNDLQRENDTLKRENLQLKQEKEETEVEKNSALDDYVKIFAQYQTLAYQSQNNDIVSIDINDIYSRVDRNNYKSDMKYVQQPEFDCKMENEFCVKLQHDLETYMFDQKKHVKRMKELSIFHDHISTICRKWDALKKNDFETLFEEYVEKLEQSHENYENSNCESIAYNILFDVIIKCYEMLNTEYNKICSKEYVNSNVIDVIWMSICNFYDLMNRHKFANRKKRIINIVLYINDKIDSIYNEIQIKYKNYFQNDGILLCKFIVRCCEIMWSVLH
eukprot:51956_1